MATTPDDPVLRKARELFSLARTVVASTWPYLMRLVMRLEPRWNYEVPTLGVDRAARLYMNPNYIVKMSVPELALKIAGHELQHVLGNHADRLVEDREEDVAKYGGFANTCHDLAINSGLQSFVDAGIAYRSAKGNIKLDFAVPTDGIYPHMFCDCHGKPLPTGLISEEYAALLRYAKKPPPQCGKPDQGQPKDGKEGKDGKQDGNGKGRPSCGSGGGDKRQPWEEDDEPDPNDSTSGTCQVELDNLRKAAAKAAIEQESTMRGTVPGGVQRWAETYLKPSKLPWRRLLKAAVRHDINLLRGQADYSWSKVSRRDFDDFFMPGMINPEPDFVFAVDSSGSMGKADLDAVFRELHAIVKTFGFKKVPVLVCDAALTEVQMISRVDDVNVTGGGGTDMRLPIDQAVRMKKKLLIIATDGYTPWYPDRVGNLKVIVCLTRADSPVPPAWMKSVICKD